MAKMQTTVVIRRPIAEVFGFFLALDENAPKTDPNVGAVVKTPDGPTGPGTTFRFRQQRLGKIRETTMRFIAIDPTRKIEFEAEIGPMRPRCDLTFEQMEGGARVTFRGDSRPVGPFALLSPIFNRKGQQVWARRLVRIKTALESSAP
jgi:polyketide cyclase/dehydrase/lipid transport protein